MHIAKKKDLVFGFILLLSSCFLFYETFFFRRVASFSIGPTLFPRFLLACLIILSICLIVQSIRRAPQQKKEEVKAFSFTGKAFVTQVLFVVLVVAYGVFLPIMGYLPCTIIFLASAMLLLGKRTAKAVTIYAAVALITALTMQFVFQGLLHLFLP